MASHMLSTRCPDSPAETPMKRHTDRALRDRARGRGMRHHDSSLAGAVAGQLAGRLSHFPPSLPDVALGYLTAVVTQLPGDGRPRLPVDPPPADVLARASGNASAA